MLADRHHRTYALVAIGGFLGSNLRYLVGLQLPGIAGTLIANVLGSFLLGILLFAGRFAGTLSREVRAVLATGVLASFTTYSTFAVDTAMAAEPELMIANVAATYALGFLGVIAGRTVAYRYVGGSAA